MTGIALLHFCNQLLIHLGASNILCRELYRMGNGDGQPITAKSCPSTSVNQGTAVSYWRFLSIFSTNHSNLALYGRKPLVKDSLLTSLDAYPASARLHPGCHQFQSRLSRMKFCNRDTTSAFMLRLFAFAASAIRSRMPSGNRRINLSNSRLLIMSGIKPSTLIWPVAIFSLTWYGQWPYQRQISRESQHE